MGLRFNVGSSIPLRGPAQQEGLRKANGMARDILLKVSSQVTAGATTKEIDSIAAAEIKARGAKSAFLGYKNFPATICISVNEEVVHGIGGPRVIQDGDIVSVDVGIFYDGWVGDNALTVPVGNVAPEVLRLLAVTEESLHIAITHAVDGGMLGALSHSVEKHVTSHGYSVVRELVGHGVGRKLHEEPQVPNYGAPTDRPRLKAGMVLAIEPMINLGKAPTRTLSDKWTVITQDRKPSAHYEHVVLVTKDQPEILTWRERMFPNGIATLAPRMPWLV
jgi:methionyl aminopeptidase